ncbi:hypothetical protein FCM35_KLT00819 [Carex littledalei]|uniref:Uncharacterized protein n=1 Tax=Carex littledalei TaxID=544730 RepID=A0A833RDV7_9POAL|nr:hypothetical protein FCM35_KLT00819 [Carex littledalei]
MVNALSFTSKCPIPKPKPKQAAASSLLSSRCHSLSSHAPRFFSLSSRNLKAKVSALISSSSV